MLTSQRYFSQPLEKRDPPKIDNKSSPRMKISLNMVTEEESKYEGKPLIDPKYPYMYKERTLKVDKSQALP